MNDLDLYYLTSNLIPRILVLITTGASLAVSGALMQSLFHNPLASPSILGVSFGGSLLVVIVSALNFTSFSPLVLPATAFLGSLFTLGLVYFLSCSQKDSSTQSLILSGIALSSVFLACQGALLYALRDRWQLIMFLTEWESGSTLNLSWKEVHMQMPLAIVGFLITYFYRRDLLVLSLGDEEAWLLGVDVKKVRFRLIFASALLSGGALAAVGIIPFFGLILPHIVRSLIGCAHPFFLQFTALGGGILLITLDSGLRYFEVYSFTVGNIAALLGGLFFLYLLFVKRIPSYA